ncbi:Imidazolonepropionase [Streptomyces griseoloalbus]
MGVIRHVDAGSVARWAEERRAPLHVHLSEQTANDACREAHGCTPAQLLALHGVLGPRTTGVHNTHLTAEDIALIGGSGTGTCMCPTTERDLADGIGPAAALQNEGSPLSLGSDSHAVIDLFEEARAMELDERLRTRTRGHWTAAALLRAATVDGHAALGWDDTGVIEAGHRRPHHRRPGLGQDSGAAAPAGRRDGRIRRDGRRCAAHGRGRPARGARRGAHAGPRRARSTRAGDPGLARLTTHEDATHEDTMSATVITNIATLVTNDPSSAIRTLSAWSGTRPSSSRATASWTGAASKAPATDNRVDAGGRAVLPGFVDSHSHLVFAGDRTEEFNARMSGRQYSAGGIRTTVAATRAASEAELEATLTRHLAEALRQGTRPSRPSPATG